MDAPTLDLHDPVALAQALVRAPSITPAEAGALALMEAALGPMGFTCRRYRFGAVDNLYAKLGEGRPVFAFAGHVDVVPPGDAAAWSSPPFAAEVKNGALWGRGAVDMKGALAAFLAATARYLDAHGRPPGSIALLITCDEEGPAQDGTKALLKALKAEGEVFDHCLVGEPTNPHRLGETIKIGRRGSLNGLITVTGRQGHVAYPDRADNPIPPLLALLTRLTARRLDDGAPHFQRSNLEITSVDVGNAATNVIPAEARAQFNIRFNTRHTGGALTRWIEDEAAAVALAFPGRIDLDLKISGEAFLTQPSAFTELLAEAVAAETGRRPALTTYGGTSDARFIKDYAPVAEFGLVGATMHQVDERAELVDIEALTRIYADSLDRYFKAFGP